VFSDKFNNVAIRFATKAIIALIKTEKLAVFSLWKGQSPQRWLPFLSSLIYCPTKSAAETDSANFGLSYSNGIHSKPSLGLSRLW
jgi:hypothetical protein